MNSSPLQSSRFFVSKVALPSLLFVGLCSLPMASYGLQQADLDLSKLLEQGVRAQLQSDAARALGPGAKPASKLKVEVSIGALDPRLQLAPCQRIEPFVPPGVRLIGRTVMGVRCLEGAQWSVTVPITVRVTGPAWVANGALAAGTLVSQSDFSLETLELSRESGQAMSELAQLTGRVLTRPLAPGQILRAEHLRLAPEVQAGDVMQVKVQGSGFHMVYDAIAMNAAAEGQPIRVRTEHGKVLSGLLRGRSLYIQVSM